MARERIRSDMQFRRVMELLNTERCVNFAMDDCSLMIEFEGGQALEVMRGGGRRGDGISAFLVDVVPVGLDR